MSLPSPDRTLSPPRTSDISPALSAYLDLMRVGAALCVFVSHTFFFFFGIDRPRIPGDDAVMVFFVLSGFVIAHVVANRDPSLRLFLVNRLARLWSVGVPALFLGLFAAFCLDPSLGGGWAEFGRNLGAVVRNLLFLGQGPIGSHLPPNDGAYWSVNNEAWYYFIFGGMTLLQGRGRVAWVAVCALLAGPAVLALMPGWLVGVWIYRNRDRWVPGAGVATGLLAASVGLYAVYYLTDMNALTRVFLYWLTAGYSYRLDHGTVLFGALMLAGIFGLSIFAVPHVTWLQPWLIRVRPAAARIGSFTFSIYLFHMPLVTILRDGLFFGREGGVGGVVTILVVLAGCLVLAPLTEHRQYALRAVLRRRIGG